MSWHRMSTMALVRSLASLLVLAVPLYASAFEPPKDPCTVLTAREASAALGATSTSGKLVVASLCEWDIAQPSSDSRNKKLTLGFLSAKAWEQTKALRERMHGISRTSVEGLGEEAVFSTIASPKLCTLQVKKGAAVLDIHLYGFPPDQAKASEITLARAALARF